MLTFIIGGIIGWFANANKETLKILFEKIKS